MKQLATAILGSVVILLVLSCNTLDPLSKKYPNMIANVDPFSVGTVGAQFDRSFSSKVNKVELEAIFHPRRNAVALEFRHEFVTYRQFWDEAARKQFAASLELYKRDFEDRKLVNNYRKTRAVYGKVKGRLEWVTFKFTKTRVSEPIIEIGYRFKENAAFFTILMRSAKEILNEGESTSPMDSQQLYMYLTRAQADELVSILDQSHLLELLEMKTGPIITDEYYEAEAEAAAEAEIDSYKEYGE
jgi:hypothetical protein